MNIPRSLLPFLQLDWVREDRRGLSEFLLVVLVKSLGNTQAAAIRHHIDVTETDFQSAAASLTFSGSQAVTTIDDQIFTTTSAHFRNTIKNAARHTGPAFARPKRLESARRVSK